MNLTKAKQIARRMPSYKNKKAAAKRWCAAVREALTGVRQ